MNFGTRMRGKIWFCVWVLFLFGLCCGRFVVEKSNLKVTSPHNLKGAYECAIGNFGIPQYGRTMAGLVSYPKSNRKACKSFDEFDISYRPRPGGLPTFLLVDRGDVDECKEKLACRCQDCKCKNTWGSFECRCRGVFLYMQGHDTCISMKASAEIGWSIFGIIFLALGAVGVGRYAVYKHRIRGYMDSEIRAIMAQYMPLDNNNAEATPNQIHHSDI